MKYRLRYPPTTSIRSNPMSILSVIKSALATAEAAIASHGGIEAVVANAGTTFKNDIALVEEAFTKLGNIEEVLTALQAKAAQPEDTAMSKAGQPSGLPGYGKQR